MSLVRIGIENCIYNSAYNIYYVKLYIYTMYLRPKADSLLKQCGTRTHTLYG